MMFQGAAVIQFELLSRNVHGQIKSISITAFAGGGVALVITVAIRRFI
jgi:hypothetical protein